MNYALAGIVTLVAASLAASCAGSSGNSSGPPVDGGGKDGTMGGAASADAESSSVGGDATHDVEIEPSDSSAEVSGVDSTADGGSAVCGSIPNSDLPASASPAMGTVTGANLRGVLCPGGAFARVESAGASYDTAPFFLILNYTVWSDTAADFDFQSPVGARNGELTVTLGLDSSSPGTYSSPGGQQCGGATFTYYLPVPPSVDCDGGTSNACPAGCSRMICPVLGCPANPCRPAAPSVSYAASGPADCIGGSQTVRGSWTLTLTSVSASDAGPGYSTPHGTLTATLVVAGGTDTATLSASF